MSANQTNCSPTKQMYSFSKTSRFRVPSAYNPNLCYKEKTVFSTPVRLDKRRTTFGASPRAHIWINKEMLKKTSFGYPLPTAFTPRNYAFESKMKSSAKSQISSRVSIHEEALSQSPRLNTNTATTFGVSRESYSKVASHSGWNHQPHDRVYPGPGYYHDRRKEQKD